MRAAIVSGLLVICGSVVYAQKEDQRLSFEVASVKRVLNGITVPGGGYRTQMSGGPGSKDPGRIRYVNVSMRTLILKAYGITTYQVSGPYSLDSELYEISANVPVGATQVQFSIMFQNLLKERFNLSFHHETKELPVYELTEGKSGAKLQIAAGRSSEPPSSEPLRASRDGFVSFPPGYHNLSALMAGGRGEISARMSTIADLKEVLESYVQRLVIDKTGLTGQYDFMLGFSRSGLPAARDSDPDGPDLFESLQAQLGLKLESKKDPVDCLVIDHIDKVPTEN